MATTLKFWTPEQIKLFCKQVRKELPADYSKWLTPRIREAIISDHILGIVRTQDKEAVKVAAIDELYSAVMVELSKVVA